MTRPGIWSSYLTTNDHALAKFSNGIRNVPSTRTSSVSKELKPDKNFAIFSKIFVNPQLCDDADHLCGSGVSRYLPELPGQVAVRSKAKDLQSGLAAVDKQIDAKLKQTGGGVP